WVFRPAARGRNAARPRCSYAPRLVLSCSSNRLIREGASRTLVHLLLCGMVARQERAVGHARRPCQPWRGASRAKRRVPDGIGAVGVLHIWVGAVGPASRRMVRNRGSWSPAPRRPLQDHALVVHPVTK